VYTQVGGQTKTNGQRERPLYPLGKQKKRGPSKLLLPCFVRFAVFLDPPSKQDHNQQPRSKKNSALARWRWHCVLI
jgi:hypothetical protein